MKIIEKGRRYLQYGNLNVGTLFREDRKDSPLLLKVSRVDVGQRLVVDMQTGLAFAAPLDHVSVIPMHGELTVEPA